MYKNKTTDTHRKRIIKVLKFIQLELFIKDKFVNHFKVVRKELDNSLN